MVRFLVGLNKEFKVNNKLKEFRKSKKMEQIKFAQEIGVSFSYLSKVERGFQNPSFTFLCKLKNRYPEVKIDKMFFEI